MWTISELKARGKSAFTSNYWICVIAAFILAIFTGAAGGSGSRINLNSNPDSIYTDSTGNLAGEWNEIDPYLSGIAAIVIVVMLVVAIVILLLKILVLNALEIGGKRFFLMNLYEKAKMNELTFAFSNNWFHCVKVLFLRDLKIFLWSLLFVIPGIIKSYEYRMIPYILAENPYISSQECFSRTKQIMDGQKWHTFVLELSFIGWALISALTLGLVGVFWTNPYVFSTYAAQYDHFRSIERNREIYSNQFASGAYSGDTQF